MKIIAIVAGGRTGSDFFQSLLDGHPEIMQFPNHFHYDTFWNDVKSLKDKEAIADLFILQNMECFDSRHNTIERHNELGENKDEYYSVDKNAFKDHFKKIHNTNSNNQILEVLKNLHIAYFLTKNEDMLKKKIIILHLHHIKKVLSLSKLSLDVIYTIRDPLSLLSSYINNWNKFKNGINLTPSTYYFNIERLFNGLKKLIDSNLTIYPIRMEDLHLQHKKVFKDFCNIFNIQYDQVLSESTFFGKKWWGDKVSGKYLNGINNDYKSNVDLNLFHKKDVAIIEKYLFSHMVKYNYPIRSVKKINFFHRIAPFKIELIMLKKYIYNFNILKMLCVIFFWIKRVLLLNKDSLKNLKLPKSLGQY